MSLRRRQRIQNSITSVSSLMATLFISQDERYSTVESRNQILICFIQKSPANQSSWIECPWPEAPIISHTISIILCKHHIVVIHRLRHIHLFTSTTSMRSIDQI